MATRLKTGGRVAGTPNRKTAEVADRLAALGCDPIEGMAKLAMDECSPPELRGRMYAELAQYIAPKRKSLDVSTEHQSSSISINIGIPQPPKPVVAELQG